MFDTATREVTWCRAPYDVAAAAKKIRDNGLPFWLADRLSAGR
jgi:diadenosine tetraphosphatase ApaH/serine/threonine PP2A family protein phosphatase